MEGLPSSQCESELGQGCRKQSPDGQAQLDVGGEVVNNSRKARGKNLDLGIFSSEESLLLHFSFKLGF